MKTEDASAAGSVLEERFEILQLTAEIVASFVQRNSLSTADVLTLIRSVHGTLAALAGLGRDPADQPKPAIAIRKSVSPDYLVCLEDGRKLKMLKRHLRSRYHLSPDEYRSKWNLPKDYPMVAPNYAAQRAAFAKKIGLGHSQSLRQRRKSGH